MKLTTMTQVTVDGVMQGNGSASDVDRKNGFERADAFLFGRRTYEIRLFPHEGPDMALDLLESRTGSRDVTIQVYRPGGRPQYAPTTPDSEQEAPR